MVINPRTGVQTLVSERYLPYFKMGKYIKKELNKHQANAKKV
jgi:Bacterial DNA-binding protein.